jgi:hypothetical protein
MPRELIDALKAPGERRQLEVERSMLLGHAAAALSYKTWKVQTGGRAGRRLLSCVAEASLILEPHTGYKRHTANPKIEITY